MVNEKERNKRNKGLFLLLGLGAVGGTLYFLSRGKSSGDYEYGFDCRGYDGLMAIPSLNKSVVIDSATGGKAKLPVGVHAFGSQITTANAQDDFVGDLIIAPHNFNSGCPLFGGGIGVMSFVIGTLQTDIEVDLFDNSKKFIRRVKLVKGGFIAAVGNLTSGFYTIPKLNINLRPYDTTKRGFVMVVNQ